MFDSANFGAKHWQKETNNLPGKSLPHFYLYIGTLINISILGEDWGGGLSVLRGLNRPFGSPLEDRALYKNMGK